MHLRPWMLRDRQAFFAACPTAVTTAGVLGTTATSSQATASVPRDLYTVGGAPCVAAHSSTHEPLRTAPHR